MPPDQEVLDAIVEAVSRALDADTEARVLVVTVHEVGERPAEERPELPAPPATNEQFLTVADLAERLQLSADTIRYACGSGELRAAKLGGGYRISPADAEEWIASHYDAGFTRAGSARRPALRPSKRESKFSLGAKQLEQERKGS